MLLRPRIFLADDHQEFLAAEIGLLQPHFEVVGTACDGAALLSGVQRLRPDVVVVDIFMPKMDGIEAVRSLIKSGSNAKFVFLTIQCSEEFVKTCLAQGALGYVWKSRMKGHLIRAIHSALDGSVYISPLSTS